MAAGTPTAATATTHFDKAEALFAARKVPEGLAEYTLAIAEDPQNAAAYLGAGDCHYFMGEPSLAAAFFEESAAIEPKAPTLRFLGDAYQKAGRLRPAAQAYERALELDPSYAAARQQLESVRRELNTERT
jgi:tetratricopeptide (TPR) repeat protein